jgi:hypothetical protein
VPLRALASVEEKLSDDDDQARARLDKAFTRFEATQPALANRVARALSRPLDETALALGYFLTLCVWLAFDSVFRGALDEVSATALLGAEESLKLDEQIRLADPVEAVESDEVVAMEQPDVLAFVQDHVDAALEANARTVDVDDVHAVYEVVLIEVLALSYAVQRPANWAMPSAELTA